MWHFSHQTFCQMQVYPVTLVIAAINSSLPLIVLRYDKTQQNDVFRSTCAFSAFMKNSVKVSLFCPWCLWRANIKTYIKFGQRVRKSERTQEDVVYVCFHVLLLATDVYLWQLAGCRLRIFKGLWSLFNNFIFLIPLWTHFAVSPYSKDHTWESCFNKQMTTGVDMPIKRGKELGVTKAIGGMRGNRERKKQI